MAFQPSQGEAPGQQYNRQRLQPGEHICRVRDVREHNGYKGNGFFIDFEVVEGPSGVGFQSAYIVYPDNARGSAKVPVERARKLELGKIQVAVAACYGWDAKGAVQVTDPVYLASIARPVSPLRGRLIRVNSVSHTNQAGKQTVFYEVYPHLDGYEAAPAPAAAAPSSAPSAPAAPATFPPAGWAVHPQNPAYYWKGTECISESELRARAA